MAFFPLTVRSPQGVCLEAAVNSVRAEDLSGWFGIRPGREPVVAISPPGFLLYRTEEKEGYVAFASAVVDFDGQRCRVMAQDAVISDSLNELAPDLDRHRRERRAASNKQLGIEHNLAKEALRRLVQQRHDER